MCYKYRVIYVDSGGQEREEKSMTLEQARWTLDNLKRLGIEAHLYELVERP